MGEKKRQRVQPLAAFVNEMKTEAIDVRAKLRPSIELGLLCSPIELLGPVSHQSLEILQVGAVIPASPLNLIGPAGLR